MRALFLILISTLCFSKKTFAVDVYIQQAELSSNITKIDPVTVDEQLVSDFSKMDQHCWVGSMSDAQLVLIPTLTKVGDDFHLTIIVMKGNIQIKSVNASFHYPSRLPHASAQVLKFALSKSVVRQVTAEPQVVATAD